MSLITSQAYSIGNFRGPLIQELAAKGITVFALAPDYDETTRQQVRDLGAEPIDISMSRAKKNPLQDIAALIRLVLMLRKLKPDASLAYFIKPVIYGTMAAWLAGVSYRFALIEGAGSVFSDTETSSRHHLGTRWLVTHLYRGAFRLANKVVFLTTDDANMFLERQMVVSEKISVMGGIGVDLRHWIMMPPVMSPVTFVLVARLLREKGVSDFAAAARIVKGRHPDANFILVGGTDHNPGSLSDGEVRSWHDAGILQSVGAVTDVRPWLAKASVFVLPSYYREGIPRSIQEALAAGRPIITTDRPGCRETVIEGTNGYFVPAKNPTALAAAMVRFIDDPTLIVRMGIQSRRLAEERFDVAQANKRLLAAIGLND